jgi:3-hydroxyacyl-CoA dehydrogenase/enoyl-CoA hydratase/3-hydroxybutyryl-CoA epimerase
MVIFETANLSVDSKINGIACIWLDVPGRTHNVFNRQVIKDLDQALDRARSQGAIKLLVIASAKQSGFVAGADLQEFTTVKGPADALALSLAGQDLFDKLASLTMPSVAVVCGACLGGGLELALACDYRVVINQHGTQIGLPEIELGLIPGWGGTQRLPRTVGIERAIQVILQRRRLSATDARRWGLADSLQPTKQAALDALDGELGARFVAEGKRERAGLPNRTWRQKMLEGSSVGRWLLFKTAKRILERRIPDDMPAPLEALHAIQTGLSRGIVEGLACEREAVARLSSTLACRNLMTLFFLIEQARKGGITGQVGQVVPVKPTKEIRKVGVVGAGTMGAGIAQLMAIKGLEVVVQEVNEQALAAGIDKIDLLYRKAVAKGVLTAEEAEKQVARLGKTVSWQGFDDVDLVIEAVIEDMEKKRDVFRELARRTKPDAILATNTSSLSVGALQKGQGNPARVAGLHFFNPVHKMPLVEVIHGPQTREGLCEELAHFAAGLGKTPVIVEDSPGFVVNRILMPYLNEAGMLVAEGMAIEKVDQVMRRFGMPLGPLELMDQVGLDVAANVARAIGPSFSGRFTPHRALEQMCEFGWLGTKSGLGFYRYRGKKKVVHTEALERLRALAAPPRHVSSALDPVEQARQARERMVCLMVNEAALCLSEGLGERAEVIDLAMVLGTGWAPHRGGPLRYADDRGAMEIVKVLDELTRQLGKRFDPCGELRQRAKTGSPFYGPLALSQTA